MSVILLTDNGSTRAGATLQLRKLAKELSHKTGCDIYPVSLQHANRIDVEGLEGVPASIFNEFMHQKLAGGEREFILIPIFFGQSKALTKYIPDEVNILKEQYGEFSVDIADVVYPLPAGEPLLSEIIYNHINITANRQSIPLRNIVLVDHGSPIPRVTDVRKHLAQSVQKMLPANCILEQAVMERREGSEYDFNGDLLEDWLKQKARAGETSAIVVLMFFLAGRHAGEGGDIVDICESVMQQYPKLKIAISPLISEHQKFIDILQTRLNNILNKTS